jgi:hypothetical protein
MMRCWHKLFTFIHNISWMSVKTSFISDELFSNEIRLRVHVKWKIVAGNMYYVHLIIIYSLENDANYKTVEPYLSTLIYCI